MSVAKHLRLSVDEELCQAGDQISRGGHSDFVQASEIRLFTVARWEIGLLEIFGSDASYNEYNRLAVHAARWKQLQR